MSAFNSNLTNAARASVLTHFAQTVTYHPLGGDSSYIQAQVVTDADGAEVVSAEFGRETRQEREIVVSIADVAAPGARDRIDVGDGDLWMVESVIETIGGLARLQCVWIPRTEISGRDYRPES